MACRIFVINETNNNNGLMRTVVANVCQKANEHNKVEEKRQYQKEAAACNSININKGATNYLLKLSNFLVILRYDVCIGRIGTVIGIGDIKNKVRAPSSIRRATHNVTTLQRIVDRLGQIFSNIYIKYE